MNHTIVYMTLLFSFWLQLICRIHYQSLAITWWDILFNITLAAYKVQNATCELNFQLLNLRFSQWWKFMSWSSRLWCQIVMW